MIVLIFLAYLDVLNGKENLIFPQASSGLSELYVISYSAVSPSLLSRLQLVQNAAAQLLRGTPK